MADDRSSTRRSFFGLAGGTALLCTIGGEEVEVSGPRSLGKADAAAARVPPAQRRAAAGRAAVQPAPGGRRREYWIQANTVHWEITPHKRDEWHNVKLPKRTPTARTATRR